MQKTDFEIIEMAHNILASYRCINQNMTVEEAKRVILWEADRQVKGRPSRQKQREAA